MEKQPAAPVYPEHLYDPVRRRIAIELLEKEFSKQLNGANIDAKAWAARFDEHTFWNAIEGFMGGTLIKPMVAVLTAGNYTWTQRELALQDIRLSSKLEGFDELGELDPHELDLSHIKTLLDHDEKQKSAQRALNDRHSPPEKHDEKYHIIVKEVDGAAVVLDGNRRCMRALLYGQETIEAWYCETNDEPPRDFWFPIDDMMDLIKVYVNSHDHDPALKRDIQAVFKEIFAQSSVAETAYRERILAVGTKGAEELLPPQD